MNAPDRWFLVPKNPRSPTPLPAVALNCAALVAVFSGLIYLTLVQLRIEWNWDAIWNYRQLFFKGWLTTIGLSIVALILSLIFGAVAALAGRSRIIALRYIYRLYVESIRSAPLLIQILFFYYVVADAFGLENRYVVGALILALFAGAYIAEILRSGVESIGKSQLEAAKAVGLTRSQTYRLVIIPQVTRQLMPPLTGQFVSLIKDSSLLSIIAIEEFTFAAQSVNSITYSALESYVPLLAGYWILTIPISLWTRQIERKTAYET